MQVKSFVDINKLETNEDKANLLIKTALQMAGVPDLRENFNQASRFLDERDLIKAAHCLGFKRNIASLVTIGDSALSKRPQVLGWDVLGRVEVLKYKPPTRRKLATDSPKRRIVEEVKIKIDG